MEEKEKFMYKNVSHLRNIEKVEFSPVEERHVFPLKF